MKTITIDLRPEDAEPILRQAAKDAARYGGMIDYITRKTGGVPGREWRPRDNFDDLRKEWQQTYLRAKRTVEAFGVEIEATSEPETMTITFPFVGGKRKLNKLGDLAFYTVEGSKPDYKNPTPHYYRDVHVEACIAAADRVVRRWREITTE